MKRVLIFKNFAILLLCVFCINSCTGASVLTTAEKEHGAVSNYQNNLVIQDMLKVSSVLKSIPIVGPILNSVYSRLLNLVMMFEYTTNSLLDKILRNCLPCTITKSNIHCDGVYKNGGMNNIIRRAIDTMPDTTPLYIIKKVLGLLLCYIDPMMMFGSFLMTGSLF